MKKLLLLFTLATLCLAASCTKNDDDIPEQENKHNLVRFKLNGEEWKSFDYREGQIFGWGFGATDLQYNPDGFRSVTLRAVLELEDQSINQSINIKIRGDSIGNHEIIYRENEFGDLLNISGCWSYDLDTNTIHQLTILEIDTTINVMMGTFEFDAVNDCGDTVLITDGYFDLTYR